MKKYNEEFELTQEELDNIATYMNDETRETLKRNNICLKQYCKQKGLKQINF